MYNYCIANAKIILREEFEMDLLKTIWPTPFKVKSKDVTSLVVQLVIFVLVCVVASVLIAILAKLPIIGWIIGIVGGLIDLYGVVGVVLAILKFCDVLKN